MIKRQDVEAMVRRCLPYGDETKIHVSPLPGAQVLVHVFLSVDPHPGLEDHIRFNVEPHWPIHIVLHLRLEGPQR